MSVTAVEKTDEIVRCIVDAVAPDRIFLFGSRARGIAAPESDYDLLVIYSGPKTSRQVQLDIHSSLKNPDFSLDVFVMSPEDFETWKTVANSLAREVAETGVAYYG